MRVELGEPLLELLPREAVRLDHAEHRGRKAGACRKDEPLLDDHHRGDDREEEQRVDRRAAHAEDRDEAVNMFHERSSFPNSALALEHLLQPAEEAPRRPELRGEDADPVAVADHVVVVGHVDDVEARLEAPERPQREALA